MGPEALRVSGLGKAFGGRAVLRDLSFTLPAGETLSVIGPSGCGKSTLLYLLAGLERPDAGSIHGVSRNMAFILQDYGLFPWKTVAENLSLPLELRKESRSVRRAAVDDMLRELGLSGTDALYPAQLSGGQRQRVAIGRALITRPDILLMDEPFSSLDAITRQHLQSVVLELWQRRRPTCILVTHDVPEAVFLGRHVMVLPGNVSGQVLWLDNPCFGDADCRAQERYFSLTREVYAALGGVGALAATSSAHHDSEGDAA